MKSSFFTRFDRIDCDEECSCDRTILKGDATEWFLFALVLVVATMIAPADVLMVRCDGVPYHCLCFENGDGDRPPPHLFHKY